MLRRAALALTFVIAGALVAPLPASAKGGGYFTMRISGGDLPYPIVLPLEEILIATYGTGWYEGSAEPPETDAIHYTVELLAVNGDGTLGQVMSTEQYVEEPQPALTESGAGWQAPSANLSDLLGRYVALGRLGTAGERPTFAEAMRASADAFGVAVNVDGQAMREEDARRVAELISEAEPVVFGIQASLVGQRDLSAAMVGVRFGAWSMTVAYVPPGPVAEYGLLWVPAFLDSWAFTTLIDPPGYWQTVFTVPKDLDALMGSAGIHGQRQGPIDQTRAVPLLEAQPGGFTAGRAEVLRDGDVVGQIKPELVSCGRCRGSAMAPVTEPLLVIRAWSEPVDPFPEAIRPAEYAYFPPTEGNPYGVLVQTRPLEVGNASSGDVVAPFYATRELDAALAPFVQDERGDVRRAAAIGGLAGLAAVVALGGAGLLKKRGVRGIAKVSREV